MKLVDKRLWLTKDNVRHPSSMRPNDKACIGEESDLLIKRKLTGNDEREPDRLEVILQLLLVCQLASFSIPS